MVTLRTKAPDPSEEPFGDSVIAVQTQLPSCNSVNLCAENEKLRVAHRQIHPLHPWPSHNLPDRHRPCPARTSIPFPADRDGICAGDDQIQALPWGSVDVETIDLVIGSVPRRFNEVIQREGQSNETTKVIKANFSTQIASFLIGRASCRAFNK
jgi:hypothetical protein